MWIWITNQHNCWTPTENKSTYTFISYRISCHSEMPTKNCLTQPAFSVQNFFYIVLYEIHFITDIAVVWLLRKCVQNILMDYRNKECRINVKWECILLSKTVICRQDGTWILACDFHFEFSGYCAIYEGVPALYKMSWAKRCSHLLGVLI